MQQLYLFSIPHPRIIPRSRSSYVECHLMPPSCLRSLLVSDPPFRKMKRVCQTRPTFFTARDPGPRLRKMLSILPTSHANSITSTSSKKKELSHAAAVANRSLCSLNRHGLPLSAFRVSSGSRGLAIRKLSVSMCHNGRGKSTPGFEVNAALKYSEDQPEIDVPVESYPTLEPVDRKLGMDMNDHEGVSEQRKGAKIHDFCLGIPFGGIVFCGGVVGFLFSRNPANLLTGILSGGAILALGILSLKVWREGKSSLPFILGQAAIAATLFRKHFQLYPLTKKLFPSGFYIAMSAAMLCFYSYVLIAGGNPPPKKKLAASPSP